MNEEYIEMFEQLVAEVKSGCAVVVEMSIDMHSVEVTAFGDKDRKFIDQPKEMNIRIVGTPKHEDDLLA